MANKFILKGYTHPNYPCIECGRTHMHYKLYVNWKTKLKKKWISKIKCRTQGHEISTHDQELLFTKRPDILESYCIHCGEACQAMPSPKNPANYLIGSNHYFEHV